MHHKYILCPARLCPTGAGPGVLSPVCLRSTVSEDRTHHLCSAGGASGVQQLGVELLLFRPTLASLEV